MLVVLVANGASCALLIANCEPGISRRKAKLIVPDDQQNHRDARALRPGSRRVKRIKRMETVTFHTWSASSATWRCWQTNIPR